MKNLLLSLATVLCCFATINAQVAITVGGGSWCSEVSWSLADASGTEVASGTCGDYSVDAADGDCFTLTMNDSYGDGWNGNTFSMADFSTGLSDGLTASEDFCYSAPVSCEDTEVIYTAGSYAGENSFTITDCDGNVLASMTSGSDGFSDCIALPENYIVNLVDSWGDGWNGGVLAIGESTMTIESGSSAQSIAGSCGVVGCMDTNAANFNVDATVDDNSLCEYSCPYVAGGVLVSESGAYSCYDYVWNLMYYTVEQMIGYGYDCSCVTDPVVGCLDPEADNYNADADIDGGCTYTCAVATVTMIDSWGDG